MSNQKIMDAFSIQSINNMLYLESSSAQSIGGGRMIIFELNVLRQKSEFV